MAGFLATTASAARDIAKPKGYPRRNLTIIVCYGARSGSNQMARALEGPAEKIMGQSISVINKPGGAGLSCQPDFVATPADGYTILQATDGIVTNYVAGRHNLNPRSDVIPLLTANIVPSQLYITAAGAECLSVPTDVSRRESVQALADAAFERFGAVHVLCNNAGVSVGGVPVADLTHQD